MVCKYFYPVCSFCFHLLDRVFYRAKVFNFNGSSTYQIFLLCIMLLSSSLRILYLILDHKDILQCFFFKKFNSFPFYIYICDTFWVNLVFLIFPVRILSLCLLIIQTSKKCFCYNTLYWFEWDSLVQRNPEIPLRRCYSYSLNKP